MKELANHCSVVRLSFSQTDHRAQRSAALRSATFVSLHLRRQGQMAKRVPGVQERRMQRTAMRRSMRTWTLMLQPMPLQQPPGRRATGMALNMVVGLPYMPCCCSCQQAPECCLQCSLSYGIMLLLLAWPL